MRQHLLGVLLAGALALGASGGARFSVRASPECDSMPGMNGIHAKPSSLAPGERAYHNAYGAPIPKPIVSKRIHRKSKTQPQLHTSALPVA